MRFLLTSFLLFLSFFLIAQKKTIDFETVANWRSIRDYGISQDGNYIWYATASDKGDVMLKVMNNNGNKILALSDYREATFSNDSRQIFIWGRDGIYEFDLKKKQKKRVITEANEFLFLHEIGTKKIGYEKNDSLIIEDLESKNIWHFQRPKKTILISEKSLLYLIRDSSMQQLDLINNKEININFGHNLTDATYDSSSSSLILLCLEQVNEAIFKYTLDKTNKLKRQKIEIDSTLNNFGFAQGSLKIADDGNTITFRVYEKESAPPKWLKAKNDLKIWNYQDKYLVSNLPYVDNPEMWIGFSFKNAKLSKLWSDSTTLVSREGSRYAVVKTLTNEREAFWNTNWLPRYYIIDVEEPTLRKFIPSSHKPVNIKLSPHSKYITWIDTISSHLFCFQIKTQNITDVSKQIEKLGTIKKIDNIYSHADDQWISNDKYLILHDEYNVYQLNPENENEAWCLTAGNNHPTLRFRTAELLDDIIGQDSILLTVKEDITHRNGFTKVKLYANGNPDITILDECLYYYPEIGANSKMPIKSKLIDDLLVLRQTAENQPNLYLIKKLSTAVQISKEDGSKEYAWFQSRLIKTTLNDSSINYGLLYLPKHLDTTKRHPIIFNFYMNRSFERFQFRTPALSTVNVNVPWYTSRGYIICVVDIQPSVGNTGPKALDCIEQMAKHLTRNYKWIDSTKMGLQGQSFGGYITNFVATHSTLFAAAQASSGKSDLISGYGGLSFGEGSDQSIQEIGQYNLQTTPWSHPQVYIENSSVFTSDKVNTPLLLMHGTYDNNVKIGQSIEIFTSLRRAGKPVWLLEYPMGHIMSDETQARDFQIKQQEFFDFYLMGKPMPDWMKNGYSK
ncbi:alpha/beta hydrolase family protein [Chitinophaga ginsengisoli]|uniref:Dipeptidyl aminopeptidase/acylaminoacyl peptidase n=1 Tax=Chitinophaga ginsengisoli TaxID=363837 RepID=A0A2P8GQ59_9BACT|nr:prolyl oligopeptidase family serine peptidase [Chitinophaga ginsengisoli]PSL36102.1 dipeptidyl aminopeptidase/acylaminoacyl peptidase [Chitinophaga ginsengisoli]